MTTENPTTTTTVRGGDPTKHVPEQYHELRKTIKLNNNQYQTAPTNPHKSPKQRSLSLSDKTTQKVIIRRTVSHEELSAAGGGGQTKGSKFAKPNSPDTVQMNKKFLIRMRRHSMNDGILNSPIEKMNPYFAKNYSKSPHKAHPGEYGYSSANPKTPTKVHHTTANVISPKRNLSITSLDLDSMLRSPPKRSKNHFSLQTDIFDFKSEPQSFQNKSDSMSDQVGVLIKLFLSFTPSQSYYSEHEQFTKPF